MAEEAIGDLAEKRRGASHGQGKARQEKTQPAKSQTAKPKQARSESGGKPARRAGPQRLSSVATAMRLLKTFSEGEVEIGVTTLARRLGVAKSTVYRLASTLVAEGMLEQNRENEKYRLGIALFGLGALVRQRMNVSNEARPHIFALREATNETVHLAVLDGDDIMYVYDLESTQAIRMRANLGDRKPVFCSSEGRAMLAFQDDQVIEETLSAPLEPRTAKTVTDPRRLRKALADVRKSGFAFEDEQCETGMRSIAAPIRDAEGNVVAAVGIAGPVERLSDEVLAEYSPLVVQTADVISARLGYKATARF